MATFRARKLCGLAWAVMAEKKQGLTRVEFAVYETYGGQEHQGETEAKRIAKALNKALEPPSLRR